MHHACLAVLNARLVAHLLEEHPFLVFGKCGMVVGHGFADIMKDRGLLRIHWTSKEGVDGPRTGSMPARRWRPAPRRTSELFVCCGMAELRSTLRHLP